MDGVFCSLPPSPLPPAPTFFSAKPSILCTRLEGGGQCVLSLHNQDPHLQIKGSEWGEVLKSCLQLITVCAVSLPRPEPGRGGSHRKFCGPIIIKPHVATRDWILLCQPQMEAYPPAPASPSPLPPHLAFQASPLVPSTPHPHPQPHPAPASSLFSSILVRSLASIYLVRDTSFLLPSLPVLCPLVVTTTSGFVLGHLRTSLDVGAGHSRAWPPREEEALPGDAASRDTVPWTQSCGTRCSLQPATGQPASHSRGPSELGIHSVSPGPLFPRLLCVNSCNCVVALLLF